MKHINLTLIAVFFLSQFLFAQDPGRTSYQLDTRIDNLKYWKQASEYGLTVPNPVRSVPSATFTGSGIRALSVITENSPDVPVITGSTSQSENSIFVNPNDEENALNSNNSTSQPGGGITLYGANDLYTFDGGDTWDGQMQGAGGSNSGDPVALIGLDGRYFVGFINNSSGQGIAYSDDQGQTWTQRLVANAPSGFGNLLDKNHMWIDNSSNSPHQGNLYNAWTTFGGSNDSDIEISRSTDGGDTWSTPQNVSNSLNAGSHCQGVNIKTGPNGEVFAVFTIYDNWPSDEDALGFARSTDGGQTYESFRIIDNIRGIRNSETSQNHRVNSFPSMAVDISNSSNRGNIYVVWTNIGVPGTNTGNDIDVYMIRSEDDGDTWSTPIRVNQDPSGLGEEHYFPWITCDPVSGTLSVVFYDSRNTTPGSIEVFCANSYDGGNSWEDFKVSDVSFSPSPIPGLASGYFGDYISISAHGGMVYPAWTDNRTGTALTYVSPYVTSTMTAPLDLQAELNEENGIVELSWAHPMGPTFDYFKIYRDFVLIGTTVWPTFLDTLPDYGIYRYWVTAYYSTEGESGPAVANVQWGSAQAVVDPPEVEEFLTSGATSTRVLTVSNPGELELTFSGEFALPETAQSGGRAYCIASGGCEEFIFRLTFGAIDNFSSCEGYQDFTDLSTVVMPGNTYALSIKNGSEVHPEDICAVWIDWDQSQSFSTAEKIIMQGSPGIGPYTATVTVPENAKNGPTRLRARIVRGGSISACGVTPYGEVEDYTVNVLAWVTADDLDGQVDPDGSQDITLSFNSENLSIGTYMANLNLTTNDPDHPQLTVPITLNVQDAFITVTTDKDSICSGSSTTLHANVTGGSGNFSYSWTSDPAGFVSGDPNPVVMPEVSTTYFVTATDGSINLNGDVQVTVVPLPTVDLGADENICYGTTALLEAGEGFATYFWSTGENTASIEVFEAGDYWVDVSNDFGCVSRDSITVFINPVPDAGLEEESSFCEGSTLTLTAEEGYESYLWSTEETGPSITVDQAGEYWVMVTDGLGCDGYDTIMVVADPLPGISAIVSGPTSVDNFMNPTSTFTAQAAQDATSYSWTVSPETAGISLSTGLTGEISWTSGFTGTADVFVNGVNDCGDGAKSQAFSVEIYSSQGISDSQPISGARVYPNPNEGSFTLEFTSREDQELTYRVTNSIGHLVTEGKEAVAKGSFKKFFTLEQQSKGIYYISIEGDKGILYRQSVIIR